MDEGGALTVAAPGVLHNDDEVEHDSLTAALVAGAPNGVTEIDPDGTLRYTPEENFCTPTGTADFTYTATDGSDISNVATGEIEVTCVNDAPTGNIADASAVATVPFSLDVAPDFSDVEGDTITFTATGLPASMSISAAGVISGTPTEAEVGPHMVTVTADDSTDTTDVMFTLEVLSIDVFSDGFED
jgi:hypothetical protein